MSPLPTQAKRKWTYVILFSISFGTQHRIQFHIFLFLFFFSRLYFCYVYILVRVPSRFLHVTQTLNGAASECISSTYSTQILWAAYLFRNVILVTLVAAAATAAATQYVPHEIRTAPFSTAMCRQMPQILTAHWITVRFARTYSTAIEAAPSTPHQCLCDTHLEKRWQWNCNLNVKRSSDELKGFFPCDRLYCAWLRTSSNRHRERERDRWSEWDTAHVHLRSDYFVK